MNTENVIKSFSLNSFICGIIAVSLCLSVLIFVEINELWFNLSLIVCFFAPFILNYLYSIYKNEKRIRKIEELMPDTLFQASLFQKGTDIEAILKHLSVQKNAVAKEFEKVINEIRKGANVADALNNFKKRNKSQIISRVVNLLIQSYENGADMCQAFRELGEDILKTQQLIRERKAAMLIERYTLLSAGALLVPFVLGLIVGLVKKLDFSGLSAVIETGTTINRELLMSNALLANQAYLIEYALIASVFVAMQENNLKKSFLYALAMIPCALAAYHLSSLFLT